MAGLEETDPVCALTADPGKWDEHTRIQKGSQLRTTNECCACDLHEGGKSVINSVDSYVWQPEGCELTPWDAGT